MQGAGTGVAIFSDPDDTDGYRLGEKIEARVTFDEGITVSTGTDAPSLRLTVGATTTNMIYTGQGSSTTTAEFSYTVAANDLDADGVAIPANALILPQGGLDHRPAPQQRGDHTLGGSRRHQSPG